MNNKLFVGGINYRSTVEFIREAFERAGMVEDVQIVTDRETGRSKGFCFVTMSDADAAKAAIEMWNGQELDGRRVMVSEARPPQRRDGDRR